MSKREMFKWAHSLEHEWLLDSRQVDDQLIWVARSEAFDDEEDYILRGSRPDRWIHVYRLAYGE